MYKYRTHVSLHTKQLHSPFSISCIVCLCESVVFQALKGNGSLSQAGILSVWSVSAATLPIPTASVKCLLNWGWVFCVCVCVHPIILWSSRCWTWDQNVPVWYLEFPYNKWCLCDSKSHGPFVSNIKMRLIGQVLREMRHHIVISIFFVCMSQWKAVSIISYLVIELFFILLSGFSLCVCVSPHATV